MDKINQFKLLLAACAAALAALWGWFGWVVLALVFLMGVDYLCGSVIAMKEHRWSSEAARSGIWHKCGCVLAVLVSGLADLLLGVILGNLPVALPFQYSVFFCPMVVVWYILTEMGSVLEHAVSMGAPVPAFLRKALAVTMAAVNEAGEHMVDGGNENA